MRKLASALLALTFIFLLLCGVAASNDRQIRGWDRALWGMNENDIINLYPLVKPASGDARSAPQRLVLQDFTFCGISFQVTFFFRVHSLTTIILHPNTRVNFLQAQHIGKCLLNEYGGKLYEFSAEDGDKVSFEATKPTGRIYFDCWSKTPDMALLKFTKDPPYGGSSNNPDIKKP